MRIFKKKDLLEINVDLLFLCSCIGIYNVCSIFIVFKYFEEFWIFVV